MTDIESNGELVPNIKNYGNPPGECDLCGCKLKRGKCMVVISGCWLEAFRIFNTR